MRIVGDGAIFPSLYGMICTINETEITIETTVQLSAEKNLKGISAVKLTDNKIFIAYTYEVDSSTGSDNVMANLYSMICTINNMEITVSINYKLYAGTNNHSYSLSVAKLTDNKVFVARGTGTHTQGMVCIISDTSISRGNITSLDTDSSKVLYVSAIALSETKVFITHSLNSTYKYLYGVVCTISGTTITTGTDTKLSSKSETAYYVSTIKLTDNKVFIAHYCNSDKYLYGIVCTISGTAITVGTDTKLNSETFVIHDISVVMLLEDEIFIAYGGSSCLYGMICSINENQITVKSNTQLSTNSYSGYSISATMVGEKIFIAHCFGSKYLLYGTLIILDKLVQLLTTSTDDIYGIAKTNAVEGQQVDVYRPYEEVAV